MHITANRRLRIAGVHQPEGRTPRWAPRACYAASRRPDYPDNRSQVQAAEAATCAVLGTGNDSFH
jgi:hypothetical protein